MTPGIQEVMRALERAWDEHTDALLVRRDVAAALNRAAREIEVRYLPTGAGGRGLDEVRAFYGEQLVPALPAELGRRSVSRTVDQFRLVQESTWRFRHDRPMPWLAPGVAASGVDVELLVVEIAGFRQGRLASRRVLWDHAALQAQLLRQPADGAGRDQRTATGSERSPRTTKPGL
jgi:carboxymethylenebutenolidase